MDIKFIHRLEQKLREPLPGIAAQKQMSPSDPGSYLQPREGHKVASVLLLLFPKNNKWHLCYIQRPTDNPHDRHAGQISFPGGKIEDSDRSLEDCALRETHEEIGISPDKVRIIGSLTELYVYVSNFRVFPFVGYTVENHDYILQQSEVKNIIEVPVSYMIDPKVMKKGSIRVRNMTLNNVPYYELFDHKLWGATAMMTSEFLHIAEHIYNP